MELELEDVMGMFSSTDHAKGMDYHHRGRVFDLKETVEDGLTQVDCSVQGSALYHVMFREVRPGQIAARCSCPRFWSVGKCKHIAAGMIAYILGPTAAQNIRSDLYAQNLLQTYMKRLQSHPVLGQEQVCLVPQLVSGYLYNKEHPAFTFRVGREKLYVIRDVKRFLDDVVEGKTATYGKALTLDHRIGNFDPRSQRLIQIMLDSFSEYRSLDHRHTGDYRGYRYQKNELQLRGSAFDRWFDETDQIGATDGTTFRFLHADPQITLRLVKGEDRAMLSVQTEQDWHFFGHSQVLYARGTDTIQRCSPAFRDRVYPLLEQGRSDMRLSLTDLTTFCGCVLPQIEDLVTLEDPDGLLREHRPEECTPCFYFDLEEDVLSLKLTYRYGEREIAAGTALEETPDIKRDVQTERSAKALVEGYFTEAPEGYRLTGEDAVYDLLTGTLDGFHRYGEVYVSDRLRGKRIQPSEAGIGISVSDGMLELELDTGGFPAEELSALYQSLLRRKKYHRLADGRYLELEGSGYETLAQMSHMLQLSDKDLQKGKLTLPAFRALYLDSLLADSDGVRIRRDREFRSMIRSFKSVTESDHRLSPELEPVLRPYQKVGFQWLKTLETCGFGGILADEMGLGKTLQVIAYLASLDREAVGSPSLVVCPTSLILNWGEELERFAPQLRCVLIMGNAAERQILRESGAGMDVWVTSYELLRQDVEHYRSLRFYCCVLDEGQHIKNQSTLVSKAVKQIDCRQRFVLTGTPIENRLSELWNLFDFLMPGYLFSNHAFREKLEKPIVKSKNEEAVGQLRRLVQPFLLRRLKQDVLKELPPKIERVRRIALSEEERRIYYAAVQATRSELGDQKGKLQILAALTQLRQICCDPDLCFENYRGPSSKLEACLELCAGMVENGHQILLFSQFTSMLDRIRQRLDRLGISSFTLQGSTPKEKRAQLVKSFNAGGASVFLISLKAGGTGLNLTAADVVIHFDPWWNLAAQEQATDRAHRIGQKAHVQVYKLIAKDTIEEKILDLQDKKAALMDAVSGDTEGGILTMSKEDLLALLD